MFQDFATSFLFTSKIKTISTIVPSGKSYSLTRNELPYVFAAAKRERKKAGKRETQVFT